jgi:flagellar L-ring protein precursor FlgH
VIMFRRIKRSAVTNCAIAAFVAGVTCDVPDVLADSLWKKRDPQRAYLFYDSRARYVGDLLTLIISEASEVDNSENRSLNKDSSNGLSGDYAGSSSGGFAAQAASASLDFASSAKRAFSGKANYRDSREYTDQITVTVVDVLPNGNLVISGRRNLSIAGEERTLVISGVVRPIDLGPDNLISSRYVADLKTVYEGEGTSKRFVRQGWLSRAANRVWPF